MIKDSYDVLGIDEYATDREVSEAYFALRKKYQEERFYEGEAGNEAAKKLTEVDNAYDEITKYRREHGTGSNAELYKKVDAAIKAADYKEAQEILDSFDERGAEWHYLQAVVYYKKGWTNESKKQLELALNLDPDNAKYKETYNRMLESIKSTSTSSTNTSWNRSGSGNYTNTQDTSTYDEPQMGGDSCTEFCCRMAICNMCLNCLCYR